MFRLVPYVLLVSSVAACTSDGDQSLIILSNVAPVTSCAFSSTESEPFVTHGKLDLKLDAAYLFVAQLKSRILLNADPNNVGAGTNDIDAKTIFLRSADVDLTFPNSQVSLGGVDKSLTHFKKLFSGLIKPGGLTDIPFELIPKELGEAVLAINNNPPNIEVVATFTVNGDLGGDTVSSQPFVFPITMGLGLTSRVVGMCPLPKGTVPASGNPCNAAQDGAVDCCTDPATNALTCPATVSLQ